MKIIVPPEALSVCQKLSQAGYEAVVVGGCVRDSLMGRTPNDWDVATDAMPDVVMSLFDKTIATGLQHGTVTVMQGKEAIEVTTYRTEGTYTDGRRPDEVNLGVTLLEDLSRRDFTVNAMAYNPLTDAIIDPYQGCEAIQLESLRAVGKASERFQEDGLRMMRAVRFAATLGFKVHRDTEQGIKDSLDNLKGISGERIRVELLKMLAASRPSTGLLLCQSTGLLGKIMPEMTASYLHPQNKWHKYDVWLHTVVTVDNTEGPVMRRMGALLHDIGKPATAKKAYEDGGYSFHAHDAVGAEIAQDIVERLKFSNEDKERVIGMVRHHMFGYSAKTSKKAMRRFLKKVGFNLVPDLVALRVADIIGKGLGENPEEKLPLIRERLWETMGEISSGDAAVSTNQLAINGKDVMAELGIGPGKPVGDTLKALLELVLDEPNLNNREALINLLPEVQCK